MEKTKELFDLWNKQKKFVEFYKNKSKPVKIWEIWMTKVWINVWSEISKDWLFSRPVLIISTHLWWDLVWVIPTTTKYKEQYSKFLLEISEYEKYWLDEKSYLLLNQFKIISLKRLDRILNNTFKNSKHYGLVDLEFLNKVRIELFEKVIKQNKNP